MPEMALDGELARLTAALPRAPLGDPSALDAVAEELQIHWPADYIALISEHDGVEGEVGEWIVVLTAVADLVDENDGVGEFWPGLVFFGSDGAEEHLAYDRQTLDVLLVRSDGGGDTWIILGSNLTEAFQHFERDDVFDNPRYHEDVTPPPHGMPDDWQQRVVDTLRGPDSSG